MALPLTSVTANIIKEVLTGKPETRNFANPVKPSKSMAHVLKSGKKIKYIVQ